MCLVVLIMLAPVSTKTDVTTSSYEGFKFCKQKIRLWVIASAASPVKTNKTV